MRLYRSILIALVMLLTIGLRANPPRKVHIRGYVLDRGREPIALATVRIKGEAIGVVTTLKGAYDLELTPRQDSLTIVYSCIGYQSVERTLPQLLSDQRIVVELADTNLSLDTLEVVTRRRHTSQLERLEISALATPTGPGSGVESLVGTIGGVSQRNELSSQYTVRGGSFDENLVYLNGVEVYRPLLIRSAEQEGLSAINPDLVEGLLFSAGGFGAEYGDKLSSVLDARYRKPSELEGNMMLGLLESRLSVGARHGKIRHLTGLRYKRGASLLSTLDTKAEYDPHYYDAQSYITYQPSSSLELSLLLNLNATNYRFVPQTRETTFGTLSDSKRLKIAFDGQEQDAFTTLMTALGISWTPSSAMRHSLQWSAYTSRERESYDITGEYILSDALSSNGGEGEGSPLSETSKALGIGRSRSHGRSYMNYQAHNIGWRSQLVLNERNRLLIGADMRLERIDERQREWEMRDSVGYTTPLTPELLTAHSLLSTENELHSTRLSLYADDRLRLALLHGDLALNIGMRLGWWSYNGELWLSPRLGLSYQPKVNDALTYRLALGLYQQAPSYRELRREVSAGGTERTIMLNKDIRAQSALVASAGMDYTFGLAGRKFRLSTEVYLKSVYHLNPYIQENIRLKYLGTNDGTALIYGLDTKLYGEFVEGIDSWLSLSLLGGHQRILSGVKQPLPNAPKVSVSLFFQDYFPGFKPIRLSLRGVYSSGIPVMYPGRGFDAPGFTSSPYRRVDLGMTYRITQRGDGRPQSWWRSRMIKYIDLGLDAFNLFDMLNTSSYYWVTDAYAQSYAVPNYLTRRTWNVYLRIGL